MNPELRRNLWMELTRHRLIGMPTVLLLVFALFATGEARDWRPGAFSSAVFLFVLLAHFWGTRLASESVSDEVRERTWDWQRLSALTPWQMTWGKLLGATAFTWYGAAICVVVLFVASWPEIGPAIAAWLAIALAGSAVALHGAAMTASLQASRKDSRLGHRIGALMFIPLALVTMGAFLFPGWHEARELQWHGRSWNLLRFSAASALAFALWAVLAAYREMCRELKARTLPWALPAFIFFLAFYGAGFAPPQASSTMAFLFAGLVASLALMYYTLFADVTNLMLARRIATHAGAGDWRRVLEELPLWIWPLLLAVVFAALASRTVTTDFSIARWRSLGLFPVAVALLAVRDAGLLAFFALGRRARRVEAATLLYIVLLWWVIPGLLFAMGLTAIATFVLPFGYLDGWQATLIAAVHAAIAWSLVGWRWFRARKVFSGSL